MKKNIKNGEKSVAANAKKETKNRVSINGAIRRIKKRKSITENDFVEIISKLVLAEPYEDNLYYREDKDYKYMVFKGEGNEEGFEVCFAIFDKEDCDNDMITSLGVREIRDLKGFVCCVAQFSETPFEVYYGIEQSNEEMAIDCNEEREAV